MYTMETKPHWISLENVLSVSNNIDACVYAFAMCENIPSKNIWPSHLEETFYIGMSGGLKNSRTFDQKNKKTGRGRYETAVHKRMKAHKHNLQNFKSDSERHYQVFHNNFGVLDKIGKKIFVCLLVPNHLIETEMVRTTISLVESEQIYMYSKFFSKLPMMNLAEKYTVSDAKKNKNSKSQEKSANLNECNLFSMVT
jgi:hypothetical protein